MNAELIACSLDAAVAVAGTAAVWRFRRGRPALRLGEMTDAERACFGLPPLRVLEQAQNVQTVVRTAVVVGVTPNRHEESS